MRAPFFGALHALAIDDRGGGGGLAFRLFAACDVERVMNAIQHTIALPPDKIAVHRAVRRKVLRQIAPLATGTQDIHHAVHGRPHVDPALPTAGLGRRNQRFNIRPLVIRQIARVSQVITIVFRSVLKRPHPTPPGRIRPPPLNPKDSADSRSFETDTKKLRCPVGGASDNCLTEAQIAAIETVHSPYVFPFPLANGVTSYPGYNYGGEDQPDGMVAWQTGPKPPAYPLPPPAGQSRAWFFGAGAARYFLAGDPKLDPRKFRAEDYK